MGVQSIGTRTDESLGVEKSNSRPITNRPKQLVADEYNRLCDSVIELQEAVGTTVSPSESSLEHRVVSLATNVSALVTGVSTVFGRVGAVVATAGDYTSTLITNASGVAGATVTAALDALASLVSAASTAASAAASAASAAQTTANAAQVKRAIGRQINASTDTLAGTDADKTLENIYAGNCAISISGDGRHAGGDSIEIYHNGTGSLTFAGTGGMATPEKPAGSALSAFDKGSWIEVRFFSATRCVLIGRLA